MMNYLWAGMLIIGAVFAAAKGNLASFTDGLMSSCGDAVHFMIELAGVMAVWSGIMEIASKSGLIGKLAEFASPFMRFLFPKERDKDTIAFILMSFTANIFGAGNSATVFSLKAMERMDEQNGRSSLASNTMCMFTAVPMSMLQLVPITVLKIRGDLASPNPGIIIIPSILAGLISMIVSIAVCKYYEWKEPHL